MQNVLLLLCFRERSLQKWSYAYPASSCRAPSTPSFWCSSSSRKLAKMYLRQLLSNTNCICIPRHRIPHHYVPATASAHQRWMNAHLTGKEIKGSVHFDETQVRTRHCSKRVCKILNVSDTYPGMQLIIFWTGKSWIVEHFTLFHTSYCLRQVTAGTFCNDTNRWIQIHINIAWNFYDFRRANVPVSSIHKF